MTSILALVPTLVVPLQKTLSEDVESRYRAITESKVGIDSCHKNGDTDTTSGYH